ncbi:MAG: PAS domain S-box protein, partial [Usitatibacter sp.]
MNSAFSAHDRRFETLFEQAPFSLQLLASDGRTLRVNKAWEALWQVSPGDGVKEYILGEYNVLTDPQLEARGVAPLMRRAFAGESIEVPAVRYDPAELGKPGRARWVRAFAHPIKDDHGAVSEVLLIHEDVTDRLQAEHDLRGSEMRLKQLANTIPQLAWMADPQGAIHWYNDRWYDYTGSTPQEMEGWGWQSVHDPKVLPRVLALWTRSIETGEPFQMTFPLRGKDGRFRPFFTLVAPLKDAAGQVVQWFGTNTDVSPLQEAQDNLRIAEERLRLAAMAGNIGIWEWDVEQDAITWSDQVHALHGAAPGGFQGGAQDFSALVHPGDRQMMWGKIESALADNSGFSAEFRALLPDGESRWLSTWARVHQSADGAGRRIIGATISIDDYKRAEEALRESDRRKDEFLAM